MIIRPEVPADRESIFAVNVAAFGTEDEARLVDRLRGEAEPFVSLVAEFDGKVVGHIVFTPVTLDGRPDLSLIGLAPMAVLPEHQRTGVGGALVREGLQRCREQGRGAVVVLGHPEYYPRFGFRVASHRNLTCGYDAPEEAFMVRELEPGYLDGASGVVRYHPAFDGL